MSIQDDIVTAMNDAGLTNMYPGAAPADIEPPFVVYQRVSQEPLLTIHSSAPRSTLSTFVFACHDKTYGGALNLADTVRAALSASSLTWHFVSTPGEEYISEVDGFMEPVYAGFWHQ